MRRKTIYEDSKHVIQSLREVGDFRKGYLHISYRDLLQKLGEPNTTDLDSEDVRASWGIVDKKTKRKSFIWTTDNPVTCKDWCLDGDFDLINEIF